MKTVIHNFIGKKGKDAFSVGRPSLVGENPEEERQGQQLIDKARSIAQRLKQESYDIAGSFRGPGLWDRVKRALRSVE